LGDETVRLHRWIARREQHWQRLEELLGQVERRGLRSLGARELQELARLYRATAGDLARARTFRAGELLEGSLQRLTVRAYAQIYQGTRRQEWQAVWAFARWGFPAAIREARGYIAIATALFVFAGVVGGWYGWNDPTFVRLMVPESIVALVRDEGELWTGPILGWEVVSSANIAINNISVTFSTVAGGFLVGVGTVYIMVLNGLLVGVVGALVGQYDLAYPFWAFVFPHGALELPAIFFAGGAGLAIARALLCPGRLRRPDALREGGRLAARLLFGIVPLLLVAGAIEGFVSPAQWLPSPVKYLLGGLLFGLLVRYCGLRQPENSVS